MVTFLPLAVAIGVLAAGLLVLEAVWEERRGRGVAARSGSHEAYLEWLRTGEYKRHAQRARVEVALLVVVAVAVGAAVQWLVAR